MTDLSAEKIFRRLEFLEGEWKGSMSNRESTGFVDEMKCRVEDGHIICESRLLLGDEEIGTRGFDIWTEDDAVIGVWSLDGEETGRYICEYEEEKDEFLFNLVDYPTSLDYRTIRRKDMMHFITMEQFPKEGTSSVETLQMEYERTL